MDVYSNLPNLCKNSNKRQREICRDKLARFSILNERKSVLYIGLGNGDAFFNNFLPLLPETVTKVVATDLIEKDLLLTVQNNVSNLINEQRKGRLVTFKQMDLLSDSFVKFDTFDCIVSCWCLRSIHNMRLAYPRLKSMLNFDGVGIFFYETYNCFWAAAEYLTGKDPWRLHRAEITYGFPPTFKQLGTDIIDMGISESTYSFSDKEYYEYNSFKEFVESLEASYTIADRLPEHFKIDNFFYRSVLMEWSHLLTEAEKKFAAERSTILLPVVVTTFLMGKFVNVDT